MKHIFPIVPASSGPLWFFLGFAIFLIGLLILFGYMVHASRHTKFEIDSGELKISGDIYGRRIPLNTLELKEAKIINLKTDHDYKMKWRTNGAALPGYASGWFKLNNGEKSLAFLTNRDRVVYIPTQNGYCLLLSVQQPEEFLHALKN